MLPEFELLMPETLAEALDLETLQAYGRQATGEKYLINPQK